MPFRTEFKIERKRAYHRTTDSRGVTRFDNLIAGFELTGVNQVWVSDIAYYRIGERFYYLTFIMDLFSRRIVGWRSRDNLMTEHTTLPAIRMAIRSLARTWSDISFGRRRPVLLQGIRETDPSL
ncbi:MAG: DDE-type integrase/transposase/recombinase [Acidobacteria bacterium]|nr:DDE-type integrase/transposase/recombinase [Acidobacteriota bacterium]